MSLSSSWPVPFLIEPHNLAIDAVVSFLLAVLVTVTINAEAQAFMATFLGDARTDAKDRFHFNAFLHLDLIGTLSFLVGGFGWPRTVKVDPDRFKRPRLYLFLTRLSGPVALLLLANIVASIIFLMKAVDYDPRVFRMVLGVCVTTAVYNLVPLPPLAAGALIYALIPPNYERVSWFYLQSGPFIILAVLLVERLTHREIFSPLINPLIMALFNFIVG